jgi:hypothetical protein
MSFYLKNPTPPGAAHVWHGISSEEPNPTGSRPRDLIGLCKTSFTLCDVGDDDDVYRLTLLTGGSMMMMLITIFA